MSNKTNIIQYWNSELPNDIKPLVNSWKEINTECEHMLFNYEQAIDFFLEHFSQSFVEKLKRIQIPAMFSDVFRVAAVKILGGLYVDCGILCSNKIDEVLVNKHHAIFLRKHNGWISNGLIYAEKENEKINKIWSSIEANIISEKDGNIWELTGPKVFMNTLLPNIELSDLKSLSTIAITPMNTTFLDQNVVKTHLDIVNNLKHKGPNHWSKLQHLVNLFEPAPLTFSRQMLPIDKELIIHIGQHNTGSTSIQQALGTADKKRDDFYYPSTGRKGSGHHALADILASNNKSLVTDTIYSLYDECLNTTQNKIILSSEYFSSKNEITFDKHRMNNIWNNLRIISGLFRKTKIVYFAREQLGAVHSRINQAIKSRICLKKINIESIIQNPTLRYDSFYSAIRFYFPESKIVFMNFDEKKHNLIYEFSSEIGINTIKEIKANKSIQSQISLTEMLEINNLDISTDEKMKLKNKVSVDSNNKSNLMLLTQEQVDIVKKHFSLAC